jgi:hypothetical protein
MMSVFFQGDLVMDDLARVLTLLGLLLQLIAVAIEFSR